MMHVVVVGAGIVGAAVADRLAPLVRTTVVEAGEPGRGTSATSFAWVNANRTEDLTYLAFRVEAMRAWERVAAEFDSPAWYARNGNLAWADTDDDKAVLAARVARRDGVGYPARIVDRADVAAIEPALAVPPDVLIAHFPDEGFVYGGQAVQALTARARTNGAHLIAQDAVVRLTTHNDRVTGVHLTSGRDLEADVVVCAAGWRTPQILATAGVTIPLMNAQEPGSPAPGVVATTEPTRHGLRGVLHSPEVDARPAANGGLTLEALDIDAGTDLSTTAQELEAAGVELLERARRILPGLRATRTIDARRCVRPLPLDGFPLVGWSRPGLYTAVSHSGITLAPHLATLITHEITRDAPTDDLTPYRPHRSTYEPDVSTTTS